MAITRTIKKSITYSGANIKSASLSFTDTQTAGSRISINELIPNGAANLLVAFTLDISTAVAFIMTTDSDLLIDTNSDVTPDDEFTLTPTSPVIWSAGDGTTIPLTADITALYVSGVFPADSLLRIEALYDPTP